MTCRLTRRIAAVLCALLLVTTVPQPARAQVLVYDDANWYEAVIQIIQLVQTFKFMLQQVQRLPVDMIERYHGHSVDWLPHDLTNGLQYAQGILSALNLGDPKGEAYRQLVDPLDVATDVLETLPPTLQRRLTAAYAGIELADRVSTTLVNQLGATRVEATHNQQVAKTMERDATSPSDAFQTQTGILNKINTATVLGLRMQDQMNASLVGALEQLLLSNRRQRDAEAVLLNATITQWRYGRTYGADLFQHTAANLDSWRPY